MQKWKEINTIEEWNQAYNQSGEKPFIILKHSTTCPVSANALKEYEEFFLGTEPEEDMDYLLVKVIESRPVSNQIAQDLAFSTHPRRSFMSRIKRPIGTRRTGRLR